MYEFDKYIKSYWGGNTVINEMFMPLENEDGTIDPIPLMYKADKILSLNNSLLTETYKEGTDYLLHDGKVQILKSGSIKTVKYKDYYLDNLIPGGCFGRTGGGYIYFGENDAMHKLQLAVSYTHSDKWTHSIPPYQGELLPDTISKLKNKLHLNVVFFGDSITVGANASGFIGVEPFTDDWCTMTIKALKKFYGYEDISYINTAVGGTASKWGEENANELVAKHKPDLVFIAFGMNDGSGRIKHEDYKHNISSIMNTVKQTNPDCEFILISTMLPNSEVAGFYGLQEEYLPVLNSLKGIKTAVADVTTIHKQLLQSKRYFDMSGNNVNHPNDFLARLYAQIMSKTLYETEF